MLSKKRADKRKNTFIEAHRRLQDFTSRNAEEENQKQIALKQLEELKKEAEEALKFITQHKQLVAEIGQLTQEVNKINRAIRKYLKNFDEKAYFEQKISVLKTTLQKREDELNTLTSEKLIIEDKLTALENSLSFSETKKSTSTTEICEVLAPALPLVRPPFCKPGEHNEENVIYPQVPQLEKAVNERIDALDNVSSDRGNNFEVKAARHNFDSSKGSQIESGAHISRGLNFQEKADGQNGDAQKILVRCSICERKREIDHIASIDGIKTLVECKNKTSLSREDKDKMLDNHKFALKMGWKVCYKFPQSQITTGRVESLKLFYYGDSEQDDSLLIIGV